MIDSFDDILIEKQEVVEEKEAVEKQEVSDELGSSEKEELKIPMIHFIENPLPGPKKHVPKEMKYAYEPQIDEMKYDYDIKPIDDFDI